MEEKFKDIIKLIENRQNEKAENILNKLLKENKEDFYTHQLLGIIYQNTGNIDKSIEHYNLSLNIRPKNAGVLFNLGIINRGLNNLSKAKEFFLKSLEVDQNFIDSYLNIARIYEIEKNLIEADQYYQKAFSVNKDYPQLNRAYSKFLINVGEITKGMSIMYKNFGNIRFGKLNLEIK